MQNEITEVKIASNQRKVSKSQKRKKKLFLKRVRFVCLFSLFVCTILATITMMKVQKTSNVFAQNYEIVSKKDTNVVQMGKDISIEQTALDLKDDKVNVPKENNTNVSKDSFTYNPNIPMPKEHQEYLYKLCKERGLDYLNTLAVLKHESQFNSKEVSKTGDYGYMQINKINHKELSKTLNTPNTPLDPYVNLNWGTYLLQKAYSYWTEAGKTGRELYECALSTYNKGLNGFKKYGKAVEYIKKVDNEIAYLKSITTN